MGKNTDRRFVRQKLSASLSASAAKLYPYLAGAGIAGAMIAGSAGGAKALNLYDGSQSGNDLEVNLNTTVSYTGQYRVNDPSAVLTSDTGGPLGVGNGNGSEGDINFKHGVVGNQFEILPVFDLRDGNFGAHVSGEAYLNTVYLQGNQNDQPGTFNPLSTTDNKSFTSATRNVDGENARLLDAFAYGSHTFDGQTIQLKVGRQTLLWGQSLFFAGNGIAAGQAPIDIITAENLANPQAQQIFLPVGQAVLTYRPGVGGLVFQGYYQFEYAHDVFQGVGAYFNSADILDKGGQRIILGPGFYGLRIKDNTPPIQNGQFGFSVQDSFGNYDVGLFGLRFDSKQPELYLYNGQGFGNPTPGGIQVANYQVVYPRDIQLYGASVSTTIGPANVAGEVSGRIHMPLVGGIGFVLPGGAPANTNGRPLYPVGDTVAAQISALYVSPAVPFDPGGVSMAGELEFNHLVTTTASRTALAVGRQASAAAFEVTITPQYYDVLPSLEIDVPIGIQYNVLGRSQIDQTMQHGTGTFNLGVTATYESNWIAALNYKDYLGKPDTTYNGLADRGFISLNLKHTF